MSEKVFRLSEQVFEKFKKDMMHSIPSDTRNDVQVDINWLGHAMKEVLDGEAEYIRIEKLGNKEYKNISVKKIIDD